MGKLGISSGGTRVGSGYIRRPPSRGVHEIEDPAKSRQQLTRVGFSPYYAVQRKIFPLAVFRAKSEISYGFLERGVVCAFVFFDDFGSIAGPVDSIRVDDPSGLVKASLGE